VVGGQADVLVEQERARLNPPGLMEASNPRRMEAMAAPRKYPDEVRERAIRLVRDLVDSDEDMISVTGACRRVGEQLRINTDTLRNWVKPALIDDGERPGLTTGDRARLVELEREVRELRRANAILKTASAFFAAELDRPQPR
jgi:transposase